MQSSSSTRVFEPIIYLLDSNPVVNIFYRESFWITMWAGLEFQNRAARVVCVVDEIFHKNGRHGLVRASLTILNLCS